METIPVKSALEIARLQVLESEDRVWGQAVRIEELRAAGAGTAAAEQLLASLRDQLRVERKQLRELEALRSGSGRARSPGLAGVVAASSA